MIKETLCEYCVFAKRTLDGLQTGCELNRLEKFETELKEKSYVVKNFCNACRNIYWVHSVENSTMGNLKSKVFDEIKMKYDIIIDCGSEYTIEQVKYSIANILKMEYRPQKTRIIVQPTPLGRSIITECIGGLDDSFDFVTSFETVNTVQFANLVKKSTSEYLLFSLPGMDISEEILENFNDSINLELKPKLVHSDESFYLCAKFLYQHFMNEKEPFGAINDYLSKISKNQCTDSQL